MRLQEAMFNGRTAQIMMMMSRTDHLTVTSLHRVVFSTSIQTNQHQDSCLSFL